MNIVARPVAVIARYTALEAVRTRFVWLIVMLVTAGFGIAAFTGELAITETSQTQTAIVASLLRLAAVVLLILFVTTSVSRDFNDKSVELMLSLPLPRGGYYLGKFFGYALVGIFSAIPLVLLVLFLSPSLSAISWGLSLMLELLLVCAVSLLFSFAFSQLTPAITASLLFYLLSRSIGAIQLMAHGPLADQTQTSQQIMTFMVDGMSWLLPDLGHFTRTDWLLYPGQSSAQLGMLGIQTLVYLLLLSSAALFDLYRKNF